MAYTKPTLAELITRVQTSIFSRIPGTDPSLKNSFLNSVLVYVIAGGLYGIYGLLDFFIKQVFPDTAVSIYLERWASIYGVYTDPAVKATGTVRFTGVDTTVIPSGTLLSRSDGVLFATSSAAIMGSVSTGLVDVPVACEEYGETGNTDTGAEFVLVAAITGIDDIATLLTPGAEGGEERGSSESLRTNLLDRLRRPPRGGSIADYERWTHDAVAATRVWVRTYHPDDASNPDQLLLGEVKVFFMKDGIGNGIPTSPQVALLQTYLEEKAEPTALIIAEAPVADPVNFTINLSPDTAEVEAAVTAALQDMFLEEASPGGTISHTKQLKTLSAVSLLDDFDLVSPAGDIVASPGEISMLGTPTYGAL